MEVNELVKGLGEKLDGLELAFDENGLVALEIDTMPVTLMNLDEAGSLAFYGVVGLPPPEDDLSDLYHALLEANHSYAGTAGATLSINAETGDVELCKALPLVALDPDSLFAELERFVNTLEVWRKIVADYRAGAEAKESGGTKPDEAPQAAAPFGEMGFMQV